MDSSFSSDSNEFLSIFKEIDNIELDSNWEKSLKVFMLQIDSKDFDYLSLKEKLLNPILWYSLSRKTLSEQKTVSVSTVKKAISKIRDYLSNTWELWEYLLYCFLESDLQAPKIKKEWVETDRDTSKFWIWYEKALISDNLWKETFSEEEEKFFKSLIYPSRNNNCNVNTGFAIFIWFEIDISKFQGLSNKDFSNKIEEVLKEKINKKKDYILEEIGQKDLQWHNLYFYFLPFSRLNETRKEITKHITN